MFFSFLLLSDYDIVFMLHRSITFYNNNPWGLAARLRSNLIACAVCVSREYVLSLLAQQSGDDYIQEVGVCTEGGERGRTACSEKGEAAKNVCGKCEKRDYCLHTKDFSFVNERRSKQSRASR